MPTPRSVYLFLAVGLLAASQSGNIIRLGQAHPVAIAAWRLLLAAAILAPLAGGGLARLRTLSRAEALLLLAAGAALATHFFAWIAAVQQTTVANAALVFSINPVLTGLAAHLVFRERLGSRLLASIALGLAGVAVIGWSDLAFRPEHLPGDLWALVCSALFTVYFLLGKRLRQILPTATYVVALYAVAAAVSFVCLLALDLPLVDYDGQTWLCFGLMALVPTVLGHTSLNHALRHIAASRISVATLSEPALAGVVAYLAWDEAMTLRAAVGYVLICASIVVLVTERRDGATPATDG